MTGSVRPDCERPVKLCSPAETLQEVLSLR